MHDILFIIHKGENLRHDNVLITVNIFSIKRKYVRPDKKISYLSGLMRPISIQLARFNVIDLK